MGGFPRATSESSGSCKLHVGNGALVLEAFQRRSHCIMGEASKLYSISLSIFDSN